MYEEILGRPASAPEQKMMDRGFIPPFKVGDRVCLANAQNVVSTITATVLFAVPPNPVQPQPALTWGFRLEGWTDFLPGEAIKPFAS